MPSYEFICQKCKTEYEFIWTFSEFDKLRSKTPCKACEDTFLVRHYRTPPQFKIPGNMTYDGITKISGSSGASKQQSQVPINIIDENPDGSCRVTRIGNKADIENE